MSEQKLRQAFIEALPSRLVGLEEVYGEWGDDGLVSDKLMLMHRLSHNLAGAAAIYGFLRVGDAARQLECILRELVREQKKIEPRHREQAGQLLVAVRAEIMKICSLAVPARNGRDPIAT